MNKIPKTFYLVNLVTPLRTVVHKHTKRRYAVQEGDNFLRRAIRKKKYSANYYITKVAPDSILYRPTKAERARSRLERM